MENIIIGNDYAGSLSVPVSEEHILGVKKFNIWGITELENNKVRYFKTNSGLGYREYAYFMQFEGEYFCIGIDVNKSHDCLYQVGSKYQFEAYELEHINKEKIEIDIITTQKDVIFAQIAKAIESTRVTDVGSKVFTQEGHEGIVVGVSLDVMLAEVSISCHVLIGDKIEKIETKKLFSEYNDFLLYKTMT